jgi:nitrogen regulatory protein PII
VKYLVLLVLQDQEKMEDVIAAWEDCSVLGVTILASAGLGRLRNTALEEDLPLIPSLSDLLRHEEVLSRTFFTVVPDEEMANKVVRATHKVLGDLNLPNTGILVVLPVAQAYGLNRKSIGED